MNKCTETTSFYSFCFKGCRPLPRPPWKIHGKSMENPWDPMGSPWGPMEPRWPPWKIQECRKSLILMKTIIRSDRMVEARGPVRCAMSFRSILSRQNGLNRHMEQNIFFGRKHIFSVFQFFSRKCQHNRKISNFPKNIQTSKSHPIVLQIA